MTSNQLLLRLPPFPVRHPVRPRCIVIYLYVKPNLLIDSIAKKTIKFKMMNDGSPNCPHQAHDGDDSGDLSSLSEVSIARDESASATAAMSSSRGGVPPPLPPKPAIPAKPTNIGRPAGGATRGIQRRALVSPANLGAGNFFQIKIESV